jgi:hypothetical protein
VLATALSLAFGIGATFWFGTAAYVSANVALNWRVVRQSRTGNAYEKSERPLRESVGD